MAADFKPSDAKQICEIVSWAASRETALEILGAGTKTPLGRPVAAEYRLHLSGLSGISLYEPEELVMTAAAGTPLAEIETRLAEKGQHLAFEPADYGPLFGAPAHAATIGGVFACNLSGPRRIKAGAARDHFLGFKGVNGRGEAFQAGGRVVKNVTGYDLPKLLAGSHGTLAVLSEVTFKVLPAPQETRTVLVFGEEEEDALAAMTAALQSPFDVSAAAHLPPDIATASALDEVAAAAAGVTAIRVEGPQPSVRARCDSLLGLLAGFGAVAVLATESSCTLWRELRDVAPFAREDEGRLWRISVPPSVSVDVLREIRADLGVRAYRDWGGGLIWLSVTRALEGDGGESVIRRALARRGEDYAGHALLLRAPLSLRASVPVFQPQPPALARVTAGVKESFDPRRVLNPGRMYDGV